MSVIYTSPYHSPDDPGGLVRETLELGDAFPGSAEDILVSWSLGLEEMSPQEAAGSLLARLALTEGDLPAGACGQLVALLRQAAKDALPSRPRRRGGWRTRRH